LKTAEENWEMSQKKGETTHQTTQKRKKKKKKKLPESRWY